MHELILVSLDFKERNLMSRKLQTNDAVFLQQFYISDEENTKVG